MIAIEVFKGRAGLAALTETWDDVYRQLPRPRFFHHHAWLNAYLNHLESDPDSVHFFVFRDETGPLAILPVKYRVRTKLGVRLGEFTLLHHSHVQLNDIVYAGGADINVLLDRWIEHLRSERDTRWDVIMFRFVLEESRLAAVKGDRVWSREISRFTGCDYIACDMSYEEFSRRLSRNFSANLRKARNRLMKEANVEFLAVSRPEELALCFQEFLELEASGWKGAGGTGTAIMLHPEFVAFYRALMEQFGALGRMRINCLKINGRVVAAQFCLLDADTIYLLKIGYDEHWSRISPGNLLLEHVIKEGTDGKAFRYVNLITDAGWHRDWYPSQYQVFNVILFNFTLAGFLFRLSREIKRRLRPVYRRLAERFVRKPPKELARRAKAA